MNKKIEKGLRNKYRFEFKGQISIEDLWDLSLKDLNSIYINLNNKCQDNKDNGLLSEDLSENNHDENKKDIVEYIFKTKREEAKQRENELLKAQSKQKILNIIEEKEEEDLRSLPIEELRKLV